MGVRLGNGEDLARVPSFVLGANEVTPLAMANAYATFAAHGLYCEPRVITSVVDRLGQQLQINGPICNQVVSREVADGVTEMLNEVIDGRLYGRTGARMYLGRPAAGKTGTTNNSAAVWFSGYTPDLAASVWVGDPRGGFRYPMKNITINGKYFSQVFGSLLPGPIWKQSMLGALKNSVRVNFALKLPPSVVGRPVRVCPSLPPFDSSASAWPTYCPTPTPTVTTPTPTPTDSATATPTPTDVDPTATSAP
jgi:membrane peptidoglycan carboxypeptidase